MIEYVFQAPLLFSGCNSTFFKLIEIEQETLESLRKKLHVELYNRFEVKYLTKWFFPPSSPQIDFQPAEWLWQLVRDRLQISPLHVNVNGSMTFFPGIFI